MLVCFWPFGLLDYGSATLQNLIPSFPWIAPPRPPRKGWDQILPTGNTRGGEGEGNQSGTAVSHQPPLDRVIQFPFVLAVAVGQRFRCCSSVPTDRKQSEGKRVDTDNRYDHSCRKTCSTFISRRRIILGFLLMSSVMRSTSFR